MRGFAVNDENALGFTAVRLHYSADPAKDPENADLALAAGAQQWLDSQRRAWPDPNDFAREFEINWFVGKGTRVFPQFVEVVHAPSAIKYITRRVLYRAWDFGWHAPVCIVAQVDGAERLLALREIIGGKQTTSDFAHRVIDECARHFPNHTAGFEDYCDPAGQQVKSLESEKNETRDVEVLQGLGIFPQFEYGWSRKDGRSLIHQLLALRGDGTPGLFADPGGCPIFLQSMLGKYVYPERRAGGKVAEEPDDETHPYADVMAALRYLVIGLHRKLGLRRLMPQPVVPSGPSLYDNVSGYGTRRRR